MSFTTADLSDAHQQVVQVGEPIFLSYGGQSAFAGPCATVRCWEDNSLVRQALEQPGEGRVLVIDGGGSLKCALVGDVLAQLAIDHGWSGVVVFGCVRDSATLARMPLGIKALQTHPRKSVKKGQGERDVTVSFAGLTLSPGDFLYSDADGIVVSQHDIRG
jgi:regulator of ribonuclease activity A